MGKCAECDVVTTGHCVGSLSATCAAANNPRGSWAGGAVAGSMSIAMPSLQSRGPEDQRTRAPKEGRAEAAEPWTCTMAAQNRTEGLQAAGIPGGRAVQQAHGWFHRANGRHAGAEEVERV